MTKNMCAYLATALGTRERRLSSETRQAVLDIAKGQGCTSVAYLLFQGPQATVITAEEEYTPETDTWNVLELLIQEAAAKHLDVWVTSYNPRNPSVFGGYTAGLWFKIWFWSLARLSLTYPNFKGIIWDDLGEYYFFQSSSNSSNNGLGWPDGDGVKVLTVDYCRDLYTEMKNINPNFMMKWVCYEIYYYTGATAIAWQQRACYHDGLIFCFHPWWDINWATSTPETVKLVYDANKPYIADMSRYRPNISVDAVDVPWHQMWYCVYASYTSAIGGGTNTVTLANLQAELEKCMPDKDIFGLYYFHLMSKDTDTPDWTA